MVSPSTHPQRPGNAGTRHVQIGTKSRLNVGIAFGAVGVIWGYIKDNNPYWIFVVFMCTESNPATLALAAAMAVQG